MGKVYTSGLSASSKRGLITMKVGKMFAALPIALFWALFGCFAVILTDLVPNQNTITTVLLVSLCAIFFLLVLAGTVLLVRHLKNEPGFWTSKTNITLEQRGVQKMENRLRLVQSLKI